MHGIFFARDKKPAQVYLGGLFGWATTIFLEAGRRNGQVEARV
jgi:hypothetical protein